MSLQGTSKSIFGFDPRTIGACQLWLDAADKSSMAITDGYVTQWNDKSGNSHNYTQYYTAPTYTSNDGGGVNFSYGQTLTNGDTWSGNGSGVDIFVVSTPWSYGQFNDWRTLLRGDGHHIIIEYGSSNLGFYNGAFYQFGSLTLGSTKSLLYVRVNSSFVGSAAINGTINPSVAEYGTEPSTSSTPFFWLGGVYQAQPWGTINELLIFSNITASQRQTIEGYLSWKWNLETASSKVLPAVHAYYSTKTASRRFNPIDIPSCMCWFDGLDSSSSSMTRSVRGSVTTVTQWKDKSGNNNSTTIRGGSPTLTSSAINGKQAILFNGSTSYYGGSIQGSGSTLTIFLVGKSSSSVTTFGGLFCAGVSNEYDYAHSGSFCITNYGGNPDIYSIIFGTQGTSSTTMGADSPFIYTLVIDGTTIKSYLNGSALDSYSYSGTFSFTQFNIGSRSGSIAGQYLFSGYLGEILMFNSGVTQSQRIQLEGYLSKKWGIALSSATHPFYNFPPSSPLPFSPTCISDCLLWLDGRDTTGTGGTQSNNTSIYTWYDKSGANKNATMSGTVVYNNNNITTSSSGIFSVPINIRRQVLPSMTLVIVYNYPNDTSLNSALFGSDTQGGWNRLQLLYWNEVSQYSYEISDGYGTIRQVSALNTTNTVIYTLVINSYEVNIYVNGVSAISQFTESSTSQTSDTNIYFGAISPVDTYWYTSVNFKEIIMYERAIADTERKQLEGHLAWKWNLQNSLETTHPYYKFRPSQLSVPLPVAYVDTSLSGSTIYITWPSSIDATSGYEVNVYQSTSENGTYTFYTSTRTSTLAYSVNVDTSYYYRTEVRVLAGNTKSKAMTSITSPVYSPPS